MLNYNQAIQIVLNTLSPLPPAQLPLARAGGKVLAASTAARWDQPMNDNSAMDGYTFAADSVDIDSPVEVVDFIPAGKIASEPIPAGKAVRIMTGAPLPQGCDTVVPIEQVNIDGNCISLQQRPGPGQNVRKQGEEFRRSETLLAPGTLLQSGEIGMLAAAGIEQVTVYPTPQIAFLVTGDELLELGEVPENGKIINSNLYLIRARLQEESYPVIELGTVGDQPDLLAARLTEGFTADLVLTTGGVSIGDHDYVRNLCDQLDMQVHFWKLAIKPGKPVLFATRNGIPFFGLPGNPAASAATFEILVRPALRRLAGHPHPTPVKVTASLTGPVKNSGKREHFLWGSAISGKQGLEFTPSLRQESGQNRTMQGFNAILPVPAGEAWPTGKPVQPLLVRMPL